MCSVNICGWSLLTHNNVSIFPYDRCYSASNYVVPLPSDNSHLVNDVPVLETILDESAIERVLEPAVWSPEMPIATIVCSLVGSEVEYDGIELRGK